MEFMLLFVVGIISLLVYTFVTHIVDYRIIKPYHFKKQKWDVNISCGPTDGGGLNLDIIERDVKNFVKIKDIYNLPYKDNQFNHVISSHTIEHVKDPVRFFNELRRISKNVTLLVPPIWDFAAFGFLMEHKWQFLTLKTKYVNKLPRHFKLPYWWYHRRFGQDLD